MGFYQIWDDYDMTFDGPAPSGGRFWEVPLDSVRVFLYNFRLRGFLALNSATACAKESEASTTGTPRATTKVGKTVQKSRKDFRNGLCSCSV